MEIKTIIMALAAGAALGFAAGAVFMARMWEEWDCPRGGIYFANAPVKRAWERWKTLRYWRKCYADQRWVKK